MHPRLAQLHPYPFERYRALIEGLAAPDLPAIDLGMGEPRHPPPDFVVDALADRQQLAAGLGAYPATRGSAALRAAAGAWLDRRFALGQRLDPQRHLLPLAGTREGLFSIIQAVAGQPAEAGALVLLPNPFYQIYEGAAVLAGCQPWYMPCRDGLPDLAAIPESVWRRCRLLVLCSPHNPTGAVCSNAHWRIALEQADRHAFVVLSDECYSELYLDETQPPGGLLGACVAAGRDRFEQCLVVHSLSKRSNLPGLRSGFVAGDATLLAPILAYRTYHGCALPNHVQAASALAWADEAHVVANRRLYRERFAAVLATLAGCLDVQAPAGGFYLWPRVPGCDRAVARDLYRQYNIRALPGSFLSRPDSLTGADPGRGHLRLALVQDTDTCTTAASRLRQYLTEAPRQPDNGPATRP